MTTREAESLIGRLSPIRFTKDNSSLHLQLHPKENFKMMELDGYTVVGWAKLPNLPTDAPKPYACMFEGDDGFQIWCHFSSEAFKRTASLVKSSQRHD